MIRTAPVYLRPLAWATRTLVGALLGLALGAHAETVSPTEVIPPNGTFGHQVVDLAVQTSAGELDWNRAWTGTYWRFNRQWDGISASYKPLATQATGGGVALASASGDADGCWVWVEDGDGGGNTVSLDTSGSGGLLPVFSPGNYLPFNSIYSQQAIPLATASVASCAYLSAPSEVFEGYRRLSSLYVGGNGTYIFKNRYTLKKQNALKLPATHTAGAGVPQSGDVALGSAQSVAGWRWQDKSGEWVEYDDNGEITRYGDRNNNTIWLQRNADGVVERMIDGPAGAASGRTVLSLQYNAAGYLAEVKDYPQPGNAADLAQRRVQYAYGLRGELTQVTDALGHVSKFEYDAKFRLNKLTDPLSHAATLAYDGDSTTVTSLTLPDGATTTYSFSYDDTQKQFYGRIQGPVTDAGQRTQSYVHDRAGDLVEYDVNGQPQMTVTHDTAAKTETRTNARGFATTLTKNEFEQVTRTLLPDGTSTSTQYESVFLNPLKYTDEGGVVTQYSYDARGNVVQSVRAGGTPDETTVRYEVDGNGRYSRVTKAGRVEADGSVTPDAVWQYSWGTDSQLTSITDPEGKVRRYSFNRAGELISSTDPLGHTTTYVSGANGSLLSTTDALGHRWVFAYDDGENLTSITDPRLKKIQMAWDEMHRILTDTNAVGGIAHTQYNAEGMPVRIADEDGRAIQQQFDAFLRLTQQTDALGNATQFGYQIADGSQAGQLGTLSLPTQVITPTYQTQLRLDEQERPTAQTVLNPTDHGVISQVSSNTFDAYGAPRTETNPNGNTLTYTRDAFGQVTAYTDSLGHAVHFVYDVRGNLLRVTDANAHVTAFQYDRNNRVIQQTLPLGQITRYTWDDTGNLASQTDPNGNRLVLTYDAADRLETRQRYNKDGLLAGTVTYTWDDADNLVGWSDNDARRNETVAAVITFDDAGRKRGETVTYPDPAGGSYSLSYGYSYSAAGYKTGVQWPDSTTIGYTWAAQGSLQSVTVPGEGVISVDTFKWTRPAAVSFPGGNAESRSYDGLLNLTNLIAANPAQQPTLTLHNQFGKAGELSSSSRTDSTGTNSSSLSSTYGYDTQLQLTAAVTDSGGLFGSVTQGYTLDAASNRIAQSATAGAWSYDANNRLQQRGSGGAAVAYGYDAAGNQVSQTLGGRVLNYEYDTQNRLIAVREGSAILIARYGYDALDRRAWKEQYRDASGAALNPAIRTYYLYGDEGLLAESTQQIGLANDGSVLATAHPVLTTEYAAEPDTDFGTHILLLKTVNAAGQSVVGYYHRDQLGTPLQVTDKAGNLIWSARYDAFGQATVNIPTTPGVTSNLRFAGQYFDAETTLHYNFRRYYDPALGRYISQDPLGLAGGPNQYLYAMANPLMYADPYGLFSAADLPTLPQSWVDFSAGFGDELLLGQGQRLRNLLGIGGVDVCSKAYDYGGWAGMAAMTVAGGIGGLEAAGTKTAGKEFSHWMPDRFFRPKSKSYNAAADKWYGWAKDTIMNGNYVDPAEHIMSDPWRYRFEPKVWKPDNPMPAKWIQQWVRIPKIFKGVAAGAAAAAAGALASPDCGCQ